MRNKAFTGTHGVTIWQNVRDTLNDRRRYSPCVRVPRQPRIRLFQTFRKTNLNVTTSAVAGSGRPRPYNAFDRARLCLGDEFTPSPLVGGRTVRKQEFATKIVLLHRLNDAARPTALCHHDHRGFPWRNRSSEFPGDVIVDAEAGYLATPSASGGVHRRAGDRHTEDQPNPSALNRAAECDRSRSVERLFELDLPAIVRCEIRVLDARVLRLDRQERPAKSWFSFTHRNLVVQRFPPETQGNRANQSPIESLTRVYGKPRTTRMLSRCGWFNVQGSNAAFGQSAEDRQRGADSSTGGRCLLQGRAASKAAAARNTVASSRQRPTICNPTGKPSAAKPQGTVAAGWPVRLKM